jgi:hypothetical protein
MMRATRQWDSVCVRAERVCVRVGEFFFVVYHARDCVLWERVLWEREGIDSEAKSPYILS